MAGHEDACWRCGVDWASEEGPQTTLRLVPAAAPSQAEETPRPRIAEVITGRVRTADEVRLNSERWTNEGRSFASEAATPLPALAARR